MDSARSVNKNLMNGENIFQLAGSTTVRWAKLAFVLALVLVTAGACGSGGDGRASEDEQGDLQMVVTFSVLADIVDNVAGDEVESTTIVGSGEDAHTFEATPSDNRALAEADVVFQNGVGFESWMEDLYKSSGSESRRVTVTKGVDLLPAEEHQEHGEHEEHGSSGHEEATELDPHVWLDPVNTVKMVGTIRDALVEADPQNAEVYRTNAWAYVAKLEELDSEISGMVEDIPEENRKLVTGHQVFGYFAERYGFEISGTAISSLTTETADPSAGEIARLSDLIKKEKVPAIFPEQSTADRRVMQQLAREADVNLASPLFTDALSETGPGDTYISMMRYNARTISGALEGE
ncbi:metal ABC transporter substrate-binding protein [soil metagenome]